MTENTEKSMGLQFILKLETEDKIEYKRFLGDFTDKYANTRFSKDKTVSVFKKKNVKIINDVSIAQIFTLLGKDWNELNIKFKSPGSKSRISLMGANESFIQFDLEHHWIKILNRDPEKMKKDFELITEDINSINEVIFVENIEKGNFLLDLIFKVTIDDEKNFDQLIIELTDSSNFKDLIEKLIKHLKKKSNKKDIVKDLCDCYFE